MNVMNQGLPTITLDKMCTVKDSVSLYRYEEITAILPFLPPSYTVNNILEVGAGNGFQALCLMEAGYSVTPLDISDSRHREFALMPITLYDGINFPFKNSTVPVLFSSNVLEHVKDIDSFLANLCKILTPNGIFICILPGPTWRIATLLCYYPWIVKVAITHILNLLNPASISRVSKRSGPPKVEKYIHKSSLFSKLLRLTIPPSHGGKYNCFEEISFFSESYWRNTFNKSGFTVSQTQPLGIFYTGYDIFGRFLPLRARKFISVFAGSSTRLYILTK